MPAINKRFFLTQANKFERAAVRLYPKLSPAPYAGCFPLMASLPFGEAEARENNRRHEDNFYRREVGKRSIQKQSFVFCKSQRNCVLLPPSYLTV